MAPRNPTGRTAALREGVALLLAATTLASCGSPTTHGEARAKGHERFGMYSSLPIAMPETEEIGDLLDEGRQPHWVRTMLDARGELELLDTLSPGGGPLPLPKDAILILAQPRPLSPDENVALDDWVRAGGKALLFADPMLTAHSIYPLGDPRRPQDVALLSPILQRWGLAMSYDERQPAGERRVALDDGGALAVNRAGAFTVAPGKETGRCTVAAAGLLADCAVGEGRLLAVADAAVLEDSGTDGENAGRADSLSRLLDRIAP